MQNILFFAPSATSGPACLLLPVFRERGYVVALTSLDDSTADAAEFLLSAFAGRPPDALVIDLTATHAFLPVPHVHRLLRYAWGEETPAPPALALFDWNKFRLPDWPAHIDDFLLPPYAPQEALARIALLLFRKRHIQTGHTLAYADMTVDLESGRAFDARRNLLPLTPREFELLKFLLTHRGKIFARDRLLDLVWGMDYEGGERTVDIHIRRLRAKLPQEAASLLETRRGAGYGFAQANEKRNV